MTHLEHEREALKLRYLPFNHPAISYHQREGNRLINERFAREGYPGAHQSTDPIMSDE